MLGSLDDKGVERVPGLDRGDIGLGTVARRKLALAKPVTQGRDRQISQFGHSITLGTAKNPCSAWGALASTSSRMPPSVTISSRRRILFGMTAVIGSTPSVRSEEHTSELQSLMRISYAVF